jgi:hypothetical protein
LFGQEYVPISCMWRDFNFLWVWSPGAKEVCKETDEVSFPGGMPLSAFSLLAVVLLRLATGGLPSFSNLAEAMDGR